jgi:hypothetical protein
MPLSLRRKQRNLYPDLKDQFLSNSGEMTYFLRGVSTSLVMLMQGVVLAES